MQMQRRILYIILCLTLIVLGGGLIHYVTTSNLLLNSASAHFSPGRDGMNLLEIKAPYGWYCVDFRREPSLFDSHKMEVMGSGLSDCPLFGSIEILSTHYPDSGGMDNIPLGQPALLYQNSDKTYELYVWIVKDRPDIYQIGDQIEQFFQ